MHPSLEFFEYRPAIHVTIKEKHHNSSYDHQNNAVRLPHFGAFAEKIADPNKDERPGPRGGKHNCGERSAMHFSDSCGNWDEDLNGRKQFSDEEKPQSFFLKYHLYFANIFCAENFESFNITDAVPTHRFIEENVSDGVAESADERSGDECQISYADKVSDDNVEHLARRERDKAVRDHERKNTDITSAENECLEIHVRIISERSNSPHTGA